MAHTSGLRPDVDLGDMWTGYDKAIELAMEEIPTAPPGERFVYSDINYFLLGDIVKRVSGLPLDQFAKKHIFDPLGMKDTGFLPAAVAAAADRADREVHAVRLAVRGARHADAARRRPRSDRAPDGGRRRTRGAVQHRGRSRRSSARMLLNGGRYNGARILSPLTVAKMTIAGERARRSERARPRLGHRLVVLVQPRRAAADRIVRAHRLHRHVDLDRSG